MQPGDRLIWVAKCTESDSLLLANSEGRAIRFCADDSQVSQQPPLHMYLRSPLCLQESSQHVCSIGSRKGSCILWHLSNIVRGPSGLLRRSLKTLYMSVRGQESCFKACLSDVLTG